MLLLLLLFDVVYKRRLPSVAAGEIYVRNDESYFAVYQSLCFVRGVLLVTFTRHCISLPYIL